MPATQDLLATKLYIPHVRSQIVPRPRMIARLNQTQLCPLTLICAPPGFGKTTLLSQWIPTSEWCVCWVSLDGSDNDPIRFWSYFIAALQSLKPELGATALELLQSPQPPPVESILTLLLNDIAAFNVDFALVLDDYHVITKPAIHAALAFLIDHLPPHMQVVITSRIDPPLPLARLRVRGQLTELRAADLRFTPDEVAAFLNEVMGLRLSADEVAALEQRTEGWIAGLQLAALSMQDHADIASFIRSFTGSHAYIIDYLAEEVVQRQSAEIRSFLLQTSILERMNGPLCDAVTGRSDSQPLLEQLEHANLFITPLDDRREWYRYHHLFAEVLQVHLRRDQPELAPELHGRASEWCEQHGLTAEAIGHALSAADFERAARLVEQTAWTLIGHGELSTLQTALDRLPAPLVQARPRLGLAYATILSISNRLAALEARLNEVDGVLADDKLRRDESLLADRDALLGQSAILRAHLALEHYEDPPRAVDLCRQALARISSENTQLRSVAFCITWVARSALTATPPPPLKPSRWAAIWRWPQAIRCMSCSSLTPKRTLKRRGANCIWQPLPLSSPENWRFVRPGKRILTPSPRAWGWGYCFVSGTLWKQPSRFLGKVLNGASAGE